LKCKLNPPRGNSNTCRVYRAPEAERSATLRHRVAQYAGSDRVALGVIVSWERNSRALHLDLEWSVSITSQEVLVRAERQSVKRLLLILVDNAIKYTPSGGLVTLTPRSTATQAVFEVIDSGIGIEPEDLPHIFERFYRASNARYVNSDGSGLGLAIAQWIANAHHGTLEALSASGERTTFRLTLPLQFLRLVATMLRRR
jgi:signal transduction histidine kinase